MHISGQQDFHGESMETTQTWTEISQTADKRLIAIYLYRTTKVLCEALLSSSFERLRRSFDKPTELSNAVRRSASIRVAKRAFLIGNSRLLRVVSIRGQHSSRVGLGLNLGIENPDQHSPVEKPGSS